MRRYFLAKPEIDVIPLLLNSFGDGSGFGVYQLVEDVIAKLPRERVLPALADALVSPHRGVRYWNVQIAARFPDPQLIPGLAKVLEESDDFDLRYAAITALEQARDATAWEVLRKSLQSEPEEELRGMIMEILGAQTLRSAKGKGRLGI